MTHTLPAVAGIPTDTEGPVFNAPWEAEAFALGVALHQSGVYSWPEFAEALSTNVASDPAGTTAYYEHWLAAVETLAVQRDIASRHELTDRVKAWRDAAQRTPHGKPILLFGKRER